MRLHFETSAAGRIEEKRIIHNVFHNVWKLWILAVYNPFEAYKIIPEIKACFKGGARKIAIGKGKIFWGEIPKRLKDVRGSFFYYMDGAQRAGIGAFCAPKDKVWKRWGKEDKQTHHPENFAVRVMRKVMDLLNTG